MKKNSLNTECNKVTKLTELKKMCFTPNSHVNVGTLDTLSMSHPKYETP